MLSYFKKLQFQTVLIKKLQYPESTQ